ncbi:hypothetical protein FDP41_007403 [Naegleria fowleri]|uniref:SAM domain-containing protein n=1 Tax=Naegleria fowleri TaxID=5763 RepID=A0A6A5C8Y6_NAEFO|nr:uncharacterized protein FDP41_007403 [Naegleria fowleri]KAF0984226.1 hypothetical protein FDP41_007403 [Naegleria fowleri]CAG4708361.1 unnamed protein product [Naegleria fowleri]
MVLQKSSSSSSNLLNSSSQQQQQIISKLLEKDISRWNCNDVALWLDLMKMSHLKFAFVQNQISGEELLELTDSELMNELKVNNENERKIIRELKDHRTNWIKLFKNLNLLSDNSNSDAQHYQQQPPFENHPQTTGCPSSSHNYSSQPSHPNLVINTSNTFLAHRNASQQQPYKTQLTPTKVMMNDISSLLELDQISDEGAEDLTSVGGILLMKGSSEQLNSVLDSMYKDCDSLKFKLYKNNDIHVVTLKKIGFSYNSLKLEIIERFQFIKPLIRYKDREGYLIRISTDDDLARVLFTHHSEQGSDVLQPIKLVIENDSSNNNNHQSTTPTTTTSPKCVFAPTAVAQQPHNHDLSNNNLNSKLLKLENENAEKSETIQELEQKLSTQIQESEKQLALTKSLQEEISSLKLQLYSMRNGVIFNPGTLKQDEEISEYIKLCKTLQHSLGNAQNKLFEIIGANGTFMQQ